MTRYRNPWIVSAAAVISAAAISACQVNPFPAEGRITVDRPVERPVAKPWGLDVPEQLEFREGEKAEYRVMGHVPAPATALLSVADLPAGATFDPSSGVIEWTPDFTAGNDPINPLADERSYPVRVLLSSSAEPQSVVERSVEFVVTNNPRPVELSWKQTVFKLREGEEFDSTVEVRSDDYPKGPFEFFMTGLPSGVQIDRDPDSPAEFRVRFTPSLGLVQNIDDFLGGVFSKTFKVQAIVVDPSGKKTVTDMDWKVIDSRKDPVITAPSQIQQLNDIRFQFTSQDLNEEDSPEVTVAKPAFGVVDVEEETDGFTTRTSVRWRDIPEDQIGKVTELKLKACVYSGSYEKKRCSNRKVLVKIDGLQLSEPAIDRSKWPLGMVNYLREGEGLRVRVPVSNPNTGSTATSFKATIEPDTMRSEVEFRNGELILSPKKAGFRQFSLQVKLPQGVSRTETFAFEALPKSWNRVLVLGDGLNDAEASGTASLISGAQMMNPLLQEMNDRALALREVLVLGTSAIANPAMLAAARPAMDRVRVVVLQSPRIDLLPSDIQTELSRKGLEMKGTISDLLGANMPGLAKLPIFTAVGSGLPKPKQGLLLQGALTPSSRNPRVLGFAPGGVAGCSALLNMTYAPVAGLQPYEFPVAVRCDSSGRRWIVSGMEWADLQAQDSADRGIVSRWLEEVLK